MKKKSASGFFRRTFFFIFVPILVFLWAGPVFAGIFKWVDENGKTHYTNDKAKIPRQYRQSDKMETLRSLRGGAESLKKANKTEDPLVEVPQEEAPVDNSKAESPAPGEGDVASLADPAPQIDEKTQAKIDQINKVVEYLKTDNRRIEQLLKEYPKQDRIGGEYLAWSNKREIRRSRALVEEIYEAGYSELEETAGHLWNRAEEAEEVQIEASKDFEKQIPELYREARDDLAVQKQYINDLEQVLKELGGQAG